MKVPIPTTIQTCHSPTTEKLLSFDDTALNTAFQGTNTTYEPTSVLDLERSPSPTVAKKPSSATTALGQQPDLDNLDGWDSILLELGLNEEFTPSSKLWSQISPSDDPHLPQFSDYPTSQPFDQHLINPPPVNLPPPSDFNLCDFSYPNFGPLDQHHQSPQQNPNNNFDFIEDLIQAAQAFESNDSHHLHLLLSRLNHRLRSPTTTNPPLHRAAYYFKEALISAASGPTRPPRLSSYEVVQSIRAHKSFSAVSPAPLFSTFAANQAILEAVDGAASVHAVDFDVGFGGHWASFLRELADRNPAAPPPSVRITAVIQEEFGVESKLVKDNLTQFARDLNINFQIDFVLFQSFEILSFKSVKFMQHEKLAVHLSPAVLHRLGNGISRFVEDLRRVSPCTVVVVDREPGVDLGTVSFSSNFVAGVEFYTGLLESLDVAAGGGGGEGVRRIEAHVLRPRIAAAVEAARGRRRVTWREAFAAAGMRTVGFSQFADYQAECLLRRAQVGGFHVAKRHGEMMLYWHDRPLVATSAWRFC